MNLTTKEKNDHKKVVSRTRNGEVLKGFVEQVLKESGFEANYGTFRKVKAMLTSGIGQIGNLKGTVNYLTEVLSAYGLEYDEIGEYLNDNCQILLLNSTYINQLLSITHAYHLDGELLFNAVNLISRGMTPDELYAYCELMKEKDDKILLHDIACLSYNMTSSYKEKLLQCYPLTPRVLGPMYYAYKKYLQSLQQERENTKSL